MPQIVETDVGDLEFPDDYSLDQMRGILRAKLPSLRERVSKGVFSDLASRFPRDVATAGADTIMGAVRGWQQLRDYGEVSRIRKAGTLAAIAAPLGEESAAIQASKDAADAKAKELEATREQRLQESTLYQFGLETKANAQEFYKTNPTREGSIPAMLSQGVASLPPMIAAGAAGPLAPVVAGLAYASMAGQQGAQEAIEMGHPEKADEAFLLFAGLGALSEAALGYPVAFLRKANIARLAGVKPEVFGKSVKNWFSSTGGRITREGLEGFGRESLQEGTEQLGQNVIASDIVGYDPDRPAMQGVPQAAAIGGVVGLGAGGVGGAAMAIDEARARRAASTQVPAMLRSIEQAQPVAEQFPATPEQRAAEAAGLPIPLTPPGPTAEQLMADETASAVRARQVDPYFADEVVQEPPPKPPATTVRRRSPAPRPEEEHPRFRPPAVQPVTPPLTEPSEPLVAENARTPTVNESLTVQPDAQQGGVATVAPTVDSENVVYEKIGNIEVPRYAPNSGLVGFQEAVRAPLKVSETATPQERLLVSYANYIKQKISEHDAANGTVTVGKELGDLSNLFAAQFGRTVGDRVATELRKLFEGLEEDQSKSEVRSSVQNKIEIEAQKVANYVAMASPPIAGMDRRLALTTERMWTSAHNVVAAAISAIDPKIIGKNIDILAESILLGKPIQKTKREQNATLRIGKSETPSLGQTPESSQEVVAQIRDAERPAVPQTETTKAQGSVDWFANLGSVSTEDFESARATRSDISKLEKEASRLEDELIPLRKKIEHQGGPKWQRGRIKKSAKKSDVSEFYDLQERHKKIIEALNTLRSYAVPVEIRRSSIRIASDTTKPLLSRLIARRDLFEGTPPEEFLTELDRENRAEVRRLFPDASPAEETRLRQPVMRAFMAGDPQRAMQMDPELNLNNQRWGEIQAVSTGGLESRFTEALQARLQDATNARIAGKALPAITRQETDRLLAEIPKAKAAALDEIAEEQRQSDEASAKMEREFTKAIKTENARDAKAAKTILVRELEQALFAAPDKQHGKASVTIEIPGDGTFKIANNKAAIQTVLDNARRISTTTGLQRNYSQRSVTKEEGKQFAEEARMSPEEIAAFRGQPKTMLESQRPPANIKLLNVLPDAETSAAIARAKGAVDARLGPEVGTKAFTRVSPDLNDESSAVLLGMGEDSRRAIEAAFGRELIFFDSEYPVNGLILPSVPGKIFLNIRSRRPLPTVVAHELMEWLQEQSPQDYVRFRTVLIEELKNFQEYAKTIRGLDAQSTNEEVLDEMAADFAGYEFQNPYFWERMAERLGSSWRRIGNTILRWLNGVIQKIRGFETTQFFKDVDRVRNALADAMAKFAVQSGSSTAPQGGDRARFQLDDVLRDKQSLENYVLKAFVSPETALDLRDVASTTAALVPDSIADEIKALDPNDPIEKQIAGLLDFVVRLHGVAPALELKRILDGELPEDVKQAAISAVLRQIERVQTETTDIDSKLQESTKTLADLVDKIGKISREQLIEQRSKRIANNLIEGYKAYLTAQAASLPANQNIAAARRAFLDQMSAELNDITRYPDATRRALEAIAARIDELPVNEGPQAVIDAIRQKDVLRGKAADSTISLLTEEQPGGLPPLLLNPAINDLLKSLAELQKRAEHYAKQIEVMEKAFNSVSPGQPSTTGFTGVPTPVQLKKWAEAYRKFRNKQADAAKAIAEYDADFKKADEDVQVYGGALDILVRLQDSPQFKQQLSVALNRPGGEILREIYETGESRKDDLTKETVYISPLKQTDAKGKEFQNPFRVHLAPDRQAENDTIKDMANLSEEITRFLRGENGPVDPLDARTWEMRRDYLDLYVRHPKFLQEDAGGTWTNPFNWGRLLFGGLTSSLRAELAAIGLRASDEADRAVRVAEQAAIGYRLLANNKEFGDAATTVAVINALNSHNWSNDRIRHWNKYVLNPIIAAGQTAGQMRLKAGDYIPGTDIQITKQDMIVAGMEKRFSLGIVQTTQGTAKGLPAILRNNPVLIADTALGKPVLRGALSPGPLTMARSFSEWGRGFDLLWSVAKTPEAQRRLVTAGDNFQMAVLGYIRTTNPEFQNDSPLLKLYEKYAKNAKDNPQYSVNSFDQLVDKLADLAVEPKRDGGLELFATKAEAAQKIEATLMAEIGQHAAAIRAQFAEDKINKDVPQKVMQYASAQNAFTKGRKKMVAPDPYYDYTLTQESDRISFVGAGFQQFQLKVIASLEALQTALGTQQTKWETEITELYESGGLTEKQARRKIDKKTAKRIGEVRFSYEQLLDYKRRLDKMIKQLKELVIDVRDPNDSLLLKAVTRFHETLSSGLLANPTAIGNNLAGGIMSAKAVTLRNIGQAQSFWSPKAHARMVSSTVKSLLRIFPGQTAVGKLARSNIPVVEDLAGWVNDMLLEQVKQEADAELWGLRTTTDFKNRMRARGELMSTAGQIEYEPPSAVGGAVNTLGSLPGIRQTMAFLRDKIPGAFDRWMNTNNARFYQDTLFRNLQVRAINAFKARDEIAARTGKDIATLNDFTQEANLLTPKELKMPKFSGYRDSGRLRQLFSTVGSLDKFLLDYYTRWKAAPESEKANVPLFQDEADMGAVLHDIESHENLATAGFTPLSMQGVGQRGLIKKVLFMFRNYPTRMFTQMARLLATDPRDPKGWRTAYGWWSVLVILIISALAGMVGKEVASPIQQAITGRSPSYVKLSNVMENPDAGMVARYVGMALASNLPYYGGVISQVLGNPGYGTWLDVAEYIPVAGLVKDAGVAARRMAQTGDAILPGADFVGRWFPPASPALRLFPSVSGDIERRNAERALRVVGPSAGMELAGGGGGNATQTPASAAVRRLISAAYRGDREGIQQAFDEAVREKTAQGSADPERSVLQSLASAVPARRVYGKSITPVEEAQLQGLMSGGQRENYAKSRDAFNLINQTLGTKLSLTTEPKARSTTRGQASRRSLFSISTTGSRSRRRRLGGRGRSGFRRLQIRGASRRKRRSPARFSFAS